MTRTPGSERAAAAAEANSIVDLTEQHIEHVGRLARSWIAVAELFHGKSSEVLGSVTVGGSAFLTVLAYWGSSPLAGVLITGSTVVGLAIGGGLVRFGKRLLRSSERREEAADTDQVFKNANAAIAFAAKLNASGAPRAAVNQVYGAAADSVSTAITSPNMRSSHAIAAPAAQAALPPPKPKRNRTRNAIDTKEQDEQSDSGDPDDQSDSS